MVIQITKVSSVDVSSDADSLVLFAQVFRYLYLCLRFVPTTAQKFRGMEEMW